MRPYIEEIDPVDFTWEEGKPLRPFVHSPTEGFNEIRHGAYGRVEVARRFYKLHGYGANTYYGMPWNSSGPPDYEIEICNNMLLHSSNPTHITNIEYLSQYVSSESVDGYLGRLRFQVVDKPSPELPDFLEVRAIRLVNKPILLCSNLLRSPFFKFTLQKSNVSAETSMRTIYETVVPPSAMPTMEGKAFLTGLTSVPVVVPNQCKQHPDVYYNYSHVTLDNLATERVLAQSWLINTTAGGYIESNHVPVSSFEIVAVQNGVMCVAEHTKYKQLYIPALFGTDIWPIGPNSYYDTYIYPGGQMMPGVSNYDLFGIHSTKYDQQASVQGRWDTHLLRASLRQPWKVLTGSTEDTYTLDLSSDSNPVVFGFSFVMNIPYGTNAGSNKRVDVAPQGAKLDLGLQHSVDRATLRAAWEGY